MLDVAKEMGILLLKGHAMLATTCPSCHAVPLLRDRQGREFCVACQAKDTDASPHQVGGCGEEPGTQCSSAPPPSGGEASVDKTVNCIGVFPTTRTSATATSAQCLTESLGTKFAQKKEKIVNDRLAVFENMCYCLRGEGDIPGLQVAMTCLEVLADTLHMHEFLQGKEATWIRCYGSLLDAIEKVTHGEHKTYAYSTEAIMPLCKLIQKVEALSNITGTPVGERVMSNDGCGGDWGKSVDVAPTKPQ